MCLLWLFVPSFLLRRSKFPFLFFVETLLVLFQPRFEIVRRLFELVAVQQTTAQGFEERSRANVVSELFVGLQLGAYGDRDEELFIQRCQPAFDAAQAQRTLACDGPV